jgi:hypothetical protein
VSPASVAIAFSPLFVDCDDTFEEKALLNFWIADLIAISEAIFSCRAAIFA